MATLIHEGCHLYAIANGIKDTSNRGVYHNRKFKEIAEERGLKITRHDKYGWTITEPTERIFNFCEAYGLGDIQITRKKQLSFIGTGNIPGIGNDDPQPANKKRSSYQRWICPSCHTIIRSTKNVNIICGNCGEHFIRDEKEGGH